MKTFSITIDALHIINAKEEESRYSNLCVKHQVCPFCASELILQDPNKLTYATCSNTNCNTSYSFSTNMWITRNEMI